MYVESVREPISKGKKYLVFRPLSDNGEILTYVNGLLIPADSINDWFITNP